MLRVWLLNLVQYRQNKWTILGNKLKLRKLIFTSSVCHKNYSLNSTQTSIMSKFHVFFRLRNNALRVQKFNKTETMFHWLGTVPHPLCADLICWCLGTSKDAAHVCLFCFCKITRVKMTWPRYLYIWIGQYSFPHEKCLNFSHSWHSIDMAQGGRVMQESLKAQLDTLPTDTFPVPKSVEPLSRVSNRVCHSE